VCGQSGDDDDDDGELFSCGRVEVTGEPLFGDVDGEFCLGVELFSLLRALGY
jgi:hypothetical protein